MNVTNGDESIIIKRICFSRIWYHSKESRAVPQMNYGVCLDCMLSTHRTVGLAIWSWPSPVLRRSCTTFFNVVTQLVTSAIKISCLTASTASVVNKWMLKKPSYLYKLCISVSNMRGCRENSWRVSSYRTTPNIKLLESRNARGSSGSEIRSHNWVMSAVSTERLGNFLKVDLDPKVAASL